MIGRSFGVMDRSLSWLRSFLSFLGHLDLTDLGSHEVATGFHSHCFMSSTLQLTNMLMKFRHISMAQLLRLIAL